MHCRRHNQTWRVLKRMWCPPLHTVSLHPRAFHFCALSTAAPKPPYPDTALEGTQWASAQ
eukprot:2406171-Pleurochrysis_carterae.AAC.2